MDTSRISAGTSLGHSPLPDFLFWNCDSVFLWKNVGIFRLPAALYDLSRT
jgi:hypothetical protein